MASPRSRIHSHTRTKIVRIADANRNRFHEGMRVCEDIARFILDDRSLARSCKTARHAFARSFRKSFPAPQTLIAARDSDGDRGKRSLAAERTRTSVYDIFSANIRRAQESSRVLEEFAKLDTPRIAEEFKKLRFRLYALEKRARAGLDALGRT